MTHLSHPTDHSDLAAKARAMTAMHVQGAPLLLPNAWDAASAYIIAGAGARAIATSSAACAWSMGLADGDHMSRDQALGQIARIVAAVDLPVTADIETGYGAGSAADAALADTITQTIAAGAVGVNLEDSGGDPLYPIEVAAHRISVARQAADAVGVPLHINARVDIFFGGAAESADRVGLTVERAAAYVAAGASSIFVPGVRDLATIAALTTAIPVPVNILAGAGSPSVAELADAGVGRISVGSGLNLALLKVLRDTVGDLLGSGSFHVMGGIPYPQINDYFAGRPAI